MVVVVVVVVAVVVVVVVTVVVVLAVEKEMKYILHTYLGFLFKNSCKILLSF